MLSEKAKSVFVLSASIDATAHDLGGRGKGEKPMQSKDLLDRLRLLGGVSAAALLIASVSYAQDVEPEEDTEENAEEVVEDAIVITGSRLRRDTFTSTAPLQVINQDQIRNAGLIDTAAVLQNSTVAQGPQLDSTITSAFVTDGGPGASNISLRGFSADQVLVLVNGRRFAPAGVEGAPALPDINLIPSSMIERVDILLDGASSIYGSDAVAGVVNVILRDEFDGLLVDGFVSVPEQSGGEATRWGLAIGDSTERSSFVFSMEYFNQERMEVQDRDYNRDPDSGLYCSRDIELDADGNVLSRCQGGIINSLILAQGNRRGVDLLFVDPVATAEVFEWLGEGLYFGAVSPGAPATSPLLAGTGYGERNNYDRLITRPSYLEGADDVIPHSERYSFFFNGTRDLQPVFGVEGIQAFVEASHSNSRVNVRNGFHGQIFPTVPFDHPLNPFDFDVIAVFASPVARDDITVETRQSRLLGGFRGDLEVFGMPEWSWEAFGGYTRSMGYSSRPALDEDRMRQSIWNTRVGADGNLTCAIEALDLNGFVDPDPCVVLNPFASSLYPTDQQTLPSFATQAEADYFTIERTVTTVVEQLTAGAFATGPVFTLPAGDVNAAFGVEWREDALDSGVDTVAAQGRAAGFFADRLTRGRVNLFEVFGEASIPVVSDAPFAESVTIDLAARLTDHEFYGQNSTYSLRGSWSLTDFLTLRGTYGTSFRAPNTRELFLAGQSGFTNGSIDPCIVPDDAADNGNYIAEEDDRDAQVISNCQTEGIDPFDLGLVGGIPSIQQFSAGNRDLDPETSTALTYGFVFEQPFFDAFDLTLGVTYFKLEVEDSIASPGAAFALDQCYNSDDFPNDPFCSRRVRDPNTGFIAEVDNTPFNVARRETSGADINVAFGYDAPEDFFGGFRLDVTTIATWSDEVISQTTSQSQVNNFVGDWGTPEWRANLFAEITRGDWSVNYGLSYIGEQASIYNNIDPDADFPYGQRVYAGCNLDGCIETDDPATPFLDFSSSITSADAVFYHDLSIAYERPEWVVRVGVNNLLNDDPPVIDRDSSGVDLASQNAPLGSGYDLVGRRFFVNVARQF
ncbi:MAG: TonB-dependent receptor [Pseudomonadota bacterium]